MKILLVLMIVVAAFAALDRYDGAPVQQMKTRALMILADVNTCRVTEREACVVTFSDPMAEDSYSADYAHGRLVVRKVRP